MMRSPPTRTDYLVRVGGLHTNSTDFNRVRCLKAANILNPELTLNIDRAMKNETN